MGLVFDPTGRESRGERNLLQPQRGPTLTVFVNP